MPRPCVRGILDRKKNENKLVVEMEGGEQEYLKFKISQNFLAADSRAFKSNPRRMILLCLLAAAGVHNL